MRRAYGKRTKNPTVMTDRVGPPATSAVPDPGRREESPVRLRPDRGSFDADASSTAE
jgi:hypothetical protein